MNDHKKKKDSIVQEAGPRPDGELNHSFSATQHLQEVNGFSCRATLTNNPTETCSVLPRLKNSLCRMCVLVGFTLYRQALNILTGISVSGRKFFISKHALASLSCVQRYSLRRHTCMVASNNVDGFSGSLFSSIFEWMAGL